MTKQIQLTQGQVALVDDWHFEELSQFKWCALWNANTKSFHATRNSKPDLLGKKHTIRMHAVVAGTPKGMKTDHIDHNTLNNQEYNLRVCTNTQNQHNRGKNSNNKSGYKGVCKHGKRWKVGICIDGKNKHLGVFDNPEDAALIYDKTARELHGEFANTNFKGDQDG